MTLIESEGFLSVTLVCTFFCEKLCVFANTFIFYESNWANIQQNGINFSKPAVDIARKPQNRYQLFRRNQKIYFQFRPVSSGMYNAS